MMIHRRMPIVVCLGLLMPILAASSAFLPPTTKMASPPEFSVVYAKKKVGLDSEVRSKLLAESIAPWRTLRLFTYASLGSGAALGGCITLAGVAAALSGSRSDLDLNTQYMNLGIDFGAVAIFAFLAKLDLDKGAELNTNVEKKMAQKKEKKKSTQAMKEREKTLAKLNLLIRISADGKTQEATVEAVQKGGKQHMILVIGTRKAIRDALLGANILKMEFAMRDVLVVPYELDKTDKMIRPEGTGFASDSRPTWETQPYVATVLGEGWEDYVNAELADAVAQNGEGVKEEGIAIVVANTGEIIRRGVGKVPWRDMVAELEKKVKEEDSLDLDFLSAS